MQVRINQKLLGKRKEIDSPFPKVPILLSKKSLIWQPFLPFFHFLLFFPLHPHQTQIRPSIF